MPLKKFIKTFDSLLLSAPCLIIPNINSLSDEKSALSLLLAFAMCKVSVHVAEQNISNGRLMDLYDILTVLKRKLNLLSKRPKINFVFSILICKSKNDASRLSEFSLRLFSKSLLIGPFLKSLCIFFQNSIKAMTKNRAGSNPIDIPMIDKNILKRVENAFNSKY